MEKNKMKKKLSFIFCFLLMIKLYSFDFNGVWSFSGVIVNNWSYIDKTYSWGKIKEPVECGFTIDLGKNIIFTNHYLFLDIPINYDEENHIFSFINPISKEENKYYFEVISDYEIILKTELSEVQNSLIVAERKYDKSSSPIHYFKIEGPKNSKKLKAPIYAKILEDSNIYFLDYQNVLHNCGKVKEGTIVEFCNLYIENVPEITNLDFNYHILVTPELGGSIDPNKIEFLDDITINGYGGKKITHIPTNRSLSE